MIELKSLTVKRERRTILHDVELSWPRGALAIVGANGSGKSTLLRAIAGAIAIDRGDVSIEGRSLQTARSDAQRRLALVPEEPSYPGHLAVRELLELCAGLRCAKVPDDARSRETLAIIGAQRYETLSLGQRKRAHLLFARVGEVPWWLLDEPSDGLDARARESLFEEIAALPSGALVATHDPVLITRCDGVVRVVDGTVVRER